MTIKKQSPKGKAVPAKRAPPAKKPAKAIKPKTKVPAAEPFDDCMGNLTPKQEAFCVAYLAYANASEAYKQAYSAGRMKPESIRVNASKLLVNTNIALRIRALKGQTAVIAMMTEAEVLLEAMKLARFDIRRLYGPEGAPIPIHLLDAETAAAVQAVDVLEEFRGTGEDRVFVGYTKKYKIADKNSALDKLFKHFGLYKIDNEQKTNPLIDLLKGLGGKSAFGVVKDPPNE